MLEPLPALEPPSSGPFQRTLAAPEPLPAPPSSTAPPTLLCLSLSLSPPHRDRHRHSAPLLAPLVDWGKTAQAAVGTRGYAGPDGLGCTDLAAHPDTKLAIPSGTTIARIRLTRPLLAADKPPCALTDWLQGVLEDNPDVPILQVRLHADDVDDVIQACTGRANPTVNKTQQRHVGTEGTMLLFAAYKPTTKKAGKDKYPFKHPHLDL